MPVFSFTAPLISPEDEKREQESLSPETRKEIQDQIYGRENNSIFEETSELLTEKLLQFHQALDKIPDKRDYVDALRQAPFLVETESNPIKFLRCEQFNASAAATRMVAYWKMRRKVFGDEQGFLPMTMASALREEDLRIIESDIIAILPNDEHGRGVLYYDRIRAVPPLASRNGVLRGLFYLMQILSEDVTLQTNGYVMISHIKGYDLYKHFDRILAKQSSLMMLECMPIKIKAAHMLAGSANGVISLILPVLKHIFTKDLRLRMVVHNGRDAIILDALKPYGLVKKSISYVNGGDYKRSNFKQWFKDQEAKEEEAQQQNGPEM